MVIAVICAFLAGCALTYLSLMNMVDAAHSAGYAKGYTDGKAETIENAK